MQKTRTRAAIAASLALALTLGGCVVTARPAYEGPVVQVAPPPPQYEVVGVAPTAGYVWFGGYWEWAGGRHVWRPGHWGPGRAGYRWVGHRWVEGPHGGWHMVPGHWER